MVAPSKNHTLILLITPKNNPLKETKIILDTLNPVEIYGVNDIYIKKLQNHFVKLQITARGNEIKVKGLASETKKFEQAISELIRIKKKFGQLNEQIIDQLIIHKFNNEDVADVPTETTKSTNEPTNNESVIVFGVNGLVIKARTTNQRKMVESCDKNDIIFAIGPAGTGKTYTAVALAVKALKNKEIKRIVLTRPAVEAGESLGFLPGDLKEKIDPYLRPLYDALYDMLPADKVKNYIENNIIEVAPLAFMRGRTLDNAYVILDEAQNATESQLKMFLTRMGSSAKLILTGDITQIDLPKSHPSGLPQAISLLSKIKGIDFIYLDGQDVVRHKLVKAIIDAYGKN